MSAMFLFPLGTHQIHEEHLNMVLSMPLKAMSS